MYCNIAYDDHTYMTSVHGCLRTRAHALACCELQKECAERGHVLLAPLWARRGLETALARAIVRRNKYHVHSPPSAKHTSARTSGDALEHEVERRRGHLPRRGRGLDDAGEVDGLARVDVRRGVVEQAPRLGLRGWVEGEVTVHQAVRTVRPEQTLHTYWAYTPARTAPSSRWAMTNTTTRTRVKQATSAAASARTSMTLSSASPSPPAPPPPASGLLGCSSRKKSPISCSTRGARSHSNITRPNDDQGFRVHASAAPIRTSVMLS